jgi:dihydropyrimidinase
MHVFDLAIGGDTGAIATASDTFPADVGVCDGKIVSVAATATGASREIDATDLLVLPGGIDSHAHIAQPFGPGIVMADSFASATAAATAGGNTCIMPFALQIRGRSRRACGEKCRALAEGRCHVDMSFHLIISTPAPEVLRQELSARVKAGFTSFKALMTHDDLVLNDQHLPDVFDVARRERALVMVHCEGYDADITLWDANGCKTITQQRLHHSADYMPWEGFAATGWPVMTILRGEVVAEAGRVVGRVGFGVILDLSTVTYRLMRLRDGRLEA